jgi:hypothetical protein
MMYEGNIGESDVQAKLRVFLDIVDQRRGLVSP